jgi:hypothetical protein
MALYRALENGFNLLLHASNSLSLACDYQGRVCGLMDHDQAVDRVLVAPLPCKGVRTIYSRGGYLNSLDLHFGSLPLISPYASAPSFSSA